jgi:hypothetical protein
MGRLRGGNYRWQGYQGVSDMRERDRSIAGMLTDKDNEISILRDMLVKYQNLQTTYAPAIIVRYKEYFLKIITASGGDTSGVDRPDQIAFPPIEELALREVEELHKSYTDFLSLPTNYVCSCGDIFRAPQDFVDHWEWCKL